MLLETVLLAVIIILVVLSALFSASEIAIFSLSEIKLKRLVRKKRNKSAKMLEKLKKEHDRTLITILLCNNFVNIAATSIATYLVIRMLGYIGVGIATLFMTLLILVFGEIFPKSFAIRKAEGFSLFAARWIYPLSFFLRPFTVIFEHVMKRVFGKRGSKQITEEDIETVLSLGVGVGILDKGEEEMIRNIFEFGEKRVEEIMVPKKRVVMVDAEKSVSDVVKVMTKTGFSRLPVFEGNREKIIGIINLKDCIRAMLGGKGNKPARAIVKKTLFVMETSTIDRLFKDMRNYNIHMSVVVNEFGNVEGIVTLEDIIEEIVGEIYDEVEKREIRIRKIGKNEYIVDASISLIDLNRKLKSNFRGENFSTLAGLLMHRLGRVGRPGDVVKVGRYTMKIEEMEGRAIKVVRIKKGR